MGLDMLFGTWQAALTALIVALTLAALLFVQRAPDMVMIGGVVLLLAAGVITPDEALRGMSNEGMITVAALFVVAAAVERTGALAALVDRALGRPTSLASAQLRTMVAPGVLSAFVNNTPVVALMVPAIRDWAKKRRLSVSKLLMPMNDAVVLGGYALTRPEWRTLRDVGADGVVSMNNRIFDTPASKELPELRAQLKDNIDRFGDKDPVIIRPNENARQERIIDVLNGAAAAGVKNLTFS